MDTPTEAVPLASGTQVAETAPNEPEIPRIGLVALCLLALLVGIVAGFGAVVFRDLIGLVHNLLFLGRLDLRYDANLFTSSPLSRRWRRRS